MGKKSKAHRGRAGPREQKSRHHTDPRGPAPKFPNARRFGAPGPLRPPAPSELRKRRSRPGPGAGDTGPRATTLRLFRGLGPDSHDWARLGLGASPPGPVLGSRRPPRGEESKPGPPPGPGQTEEPRHLPPSGDQVVQGSRLRVPGWLKPCWQSPSPKTGFSWFPATGPRTAQTLLAISFSGDRLFTGFNDGYSDGSNQVRKLLSRRPAFPGSRLRAPE